MQCNPPMLKKKIDKMTFIPLTFLLKVIWFFSGFVRVQWKKSTGGISCIKLKVHELSPK